VAAFKRDVFLHLVPNERFPNRLFGEGPRDLHWVLLGRSVTRLLVRLELTYEDAWCKASTRLWLPWGDLLMMRKQLLTLRALAETAPGLGEPAGNS
jgi:hypothetical protein